jgi:hypothetical protein
MQELEAQLQALHEKEAEERERQKASMSPVFFPPPFLL